MNRMRKAYRLTGHSAARLPPAADLRQRTRDSAFGCRTAHQNVPRLDDRHVVVSPATPRSPRVGNGGQRYPVGAICAPAGSVQEATQTTFEIAIRDHVTRYPAGETRPRRLALARDLGNRGGRRSGRPQPDLRDQSTIRRVRPRSPNRNVLSGVADALTGCVAAACPPYRTSRRPIGTASTTAIKTRTTTTRVHGLPLVFRPPCPAFVAESVGGVPSEPPGEQDAGDEVDEQPSPSRPQPSPVPMIPHRLAP